MNTIQVRLNLPDRIMTLGAARQLDKAVEDQDHQHVHTLHVQLLGRWTYVAGQNCFASVIDQLWSMLHLDASDGAAFSFSFSRALDPSVGGVGALVTIGLRHIGLREPGGAP